MNVMDKAPFAAAKKQPFMADREFLPADLEILETPPSPVRMALILIICGFVVVALAWSYFGRIDIIAVAQGKIQPTGRVKVIEPLEPGKVAVIHVQNGQHVKAGEVLIEMDAGDARAEEADAQSAYDAYHAEALRREAAFHAARARRLEPAPAIAWGSDTPEAIRTREDQVLASDLAQLSDVVADFDAQIRQKQIERDRTRRHDGRPRQADRCLAGARDHALDFGQVRFGLQIGADRRAGDTSLPHDPIGDAEGPARRRRR